MDKLQWYEIRVENWLGTGCSAGFEGFSIRHTDAGETVLSARMDQAALHGALMRIRDLGLVLASVRRVDISNRTSPVDG